ncbi:MAG: sulfurtransferase TusA family protein [Gammaproteobacteria bacterium]|nr:sulfurtransferase TusA family protein [Gammaproteobacteria bacterium]
MHCDQELDALALVCPLPLLYAKRKLKTMAVGEVLKVITRDPSSVIDFRTYTSVSGHVLLSYEEKDSVFVFYVQKS